MEAVLRPRGDRDESEIVDDGLPHVVGIERFGHEHLIAGIGHNLECEFERFATTYGDAEVPCFERDAALFVIGEERVDCLGDA